MASPALQQQCFDQIEQLRRKGDSIPAKTSGAPVAGMEKNKEHGKSGNDKNTQKGSERGRKEKAKKPKKDSDVAKGHGKRGASDEEV